MKTFKYSMAVLAGMLIIIGNASALTLRLTSPIGGETWVIGRTQPITWTYSGPDCRLKLELLLGVRHWTIAENIPANQQTYLWRVGDYKKVTVGPGGRPPADNSYKIQLTIEPRGHTSCEWTTSTSNGLFTLVDPIQKSTGKEIQKAPGMPPIKGVGSSFKCTFKPWSSGLPAGGPLGGTGEFQYGMTLKVENVGSTKFYEIHGTLELKVNGANKSHTCSFPSGALNQSSLDPGKSASHNLNCGSESNVNSSEIISGRAYVQSNDGKKFYCTLDTSVPKVY